MAETVETVKAQLATKVKSYESKVAALNAINCALQKENTKLRKDLSKAAAGSDGDVNDAEEELQELREEFATRLGAAERAVETLKDDKARLQLQLSQATAGGSASEYRVNELQEGIDRLKAEGESLSKKNGELEAVVRKLRNSVRDLEAERDKLASRSKGLEAQVLELQDKAEKDAHSATTQIEELEHEIAEVRREAKKQVAEARREAEDARLRAENEAAKGGAELLSVAREREAALTLSLSELRGAMEAATNEAANREDNLRRERREMEERLRAIQAEKEDIAASTTGATQPLLKQIESMAAATAAAQQAAEVAEAKMAVRLRAAEAAAAAASEAERASAVRCSAAEAAGAAARDAVGQATASLAELKGKFEAERRRAATLDAERTSAQERMSAGQAREEKLRKELDQQRREAHDKLWELDQRLRAITKERDELLQRLEASQELFQQQLQQQQQQRGAQSSRSVTAATAANGASASGRSPAGLVRRRAQALGHLMGSSTSLADMGGNGEEEEDALPATADVGRTGGTDGVVSPALTSAVDNELDGLLRAFTVSAATRGGGGVAGGTQRVNSGGSSSNGFGDLDAAKVQRTLELLQARLAAAECARDHAAEQLLLAMQRVDSLTEESRAVGDLQRQLKEAERKIDLALECLGERNERVEQLEEDIEEMKLIFQQQLAEAMDQLVQAQGGTAPIGRRGLVVPDREGSTKGGKAAKAM